jgi:hypothetical protein
MIEGGRGATGFADPGGLGGDGGFGGAASFRFAAAALSWAASTVF